MITKRLLQTILEQIESVERLLEGRASSTIEADAKILTERAKESIEYAMQLADE